MKFWNFIFEQLSNQNQVILMSVIESRGSSPGRQGFKMAVSENFEMQGSIGGGIMEYQMVELAKTLFDKPFKSFIKRQNHNKKAEKDQSGMICSGHQIIAFHLLTPEEKNIQLIKEIITCLKNNCNKNLILQADKLYLSDRKQDNRYEIKTTDEKNWEYSEKIAYKHEIYIIGGGHVGLALSEMMHFLNFYVHIIDERKDLNTLEKNKFAHKIHRIKFSEIDKLIPEGNNVYAVIMTHKHIDDKNVLKYLIRKNLKYLGLMGSKTKVKTIFEQLKSENFTDKDLEKVHSPIGIDIKSETPEEIAVSIAAEIIKIKNKG